MLYVSGHLLSLISIRLLLSVRTNVWDVEYQNTVSNAVSLAAAWWILPLYYVQQSVETA